MKKLLLTGIIFFNFSHAETWDCEKNINLSNSVNINEKNIYTRFDNIFIKSSQFGDKKFSILYEDDVFISLLHKNDPKSFLNIFFFKNKPFYLENIISNHDYINVSSGNCLVLN
jgi:hypothetical protein